MTPKEAWKAARTLEKGLSGHHTTPKVERFRKENKEIAANAQENIEVITKHFTKVFNTVRPTYAEAATLIKQRETWNELGDPPTWKEFKQAVFRLKNDKAPGGYGVPANAFKCLDNRNLSVLFEYIVRFWKGEEDYYEWHEGIGVLVPKKGDLHDLNFWRCINLMDMGAKVLSRILTERAYKLLDKNCVKTQFGATPLVGCQDGNFVLKTLLHLRRQHNLQTFVAFIDLVKAYDTANHVPRASN
jgi:hypothetical protein